MNFTDIFIRRPVLATVVSLINLVLGLRSVMSLPILQYPRTQNAVITVTTVYYGADPAVATTKEGAPWTFAKSDRIGIFFAMVALAVRRPAKFQTAPTDLSLVFASWTEKSPSSPMVSLDAFLRHDGSVYR